MRRYLALVLFLGSTQAAAAPMEIQQLIREAAIDPSVRVHPLSVTGAPALTTSIQFGDSFESSNVLCAQCIEVAPGQAEAALEASKNDTRNWIIEKRPQERSIHVRPHHLPSLDNPPSAFNTNVYVLLNGGHAVNVELRLLHLSEGQRAADAVVSVRMPEDITLTGRLAEERGKLIQKFEADKSEQSHQLFLTRLGGNVHCKTVHWRRPHRNDAIHVRLNQLCYSAAEERTFWITFEVENRSSKTLFLGTASLEPGVAVSVQKDPVSSYIDHSALAMRERAQGIALASLTKDSPVPSTWRLVVNPASPDRESVEIDGVEF